MSQLTNLEDLSLDNTSLSLTLDKANNFSAGLPDVVSDLNSIKKLNLAHCMLDSLLERLVITISRYIVDPIVSFHSKFPW